MVLRSYILLGFRSYEFFFNFFNKQLHTWRQTTSGSNDYHKHQALNRADCRILYAEAETLNTGTHATILFPPLQNLRLYSSTCVCDHPSKTKSPETRCLRLRPRVTDGTRNLAWEGAREGGLVCHLPPTLELLCLSCDETATPSRRPSVVSFPPLISSCYGLALFSCLLVNKPSCLPVLIHWGISQPTTTPPPPPAPCTQAN